MVIVTEKEQLTKPLNILIDKAKKGYETKVAEEKEKEATEEEGGGQPDTASLVILLVGGLLLFLFYIGLKYYTTDSLRWI